MDDPDLRMAILREMANLRHELATLHATRPVLGPREFLERYELHLKDRLARLEQALKDAEERAAD